MELYNPVSQKTCELPDITGGGSRFHSQCGGLLCGGVSSQDSCLMLDTLTGTFTNTSVKLVEERKGHLCWEVDGEGGPILLMGGLYSDRSTELVSSDGLTSSASFTLQYNPE